MNLLLEKLYLEKEEFVEAPALKSYCKALNLRYDTTVRCLLSAGYLTRIFRGIFRVNSLEEVKLKHVKCSHLELVSKGLAMKGVENWYFGLHTALKLNNATHEYFTTDYVINDKVFRAKPVAMAGHSFRFIKLKPSLFGFGAKHTANGLPFSDLEKTVLDFAYVRRYNGTPKDRVALELKEWSDRLNRAKLRKYAKHYPTTVREIADELVSG